MEKPFRDMVEVFYADVCLNGYLEILEDSISLVLKVEDENLIEQFGSWDERTFTFHCKKSNNLFISLFDCFMTRINDSGSNGYVFIFSPRLFVDKSRDTDIDDISEFKLSTLSAIYFDLHPLFKDLKEDQKVSGSFDFDNEQVLFKIESFENINGTKTRVTFRTKDKKDFSYFDNLFLRFTTIISFLSNGFIPSEYYIYFPDYPFTDIYGEINYNYGKKNNSSKKPKGTKHIYKLKGDSDSIKKHIMLPMIKDSFRFFIYFNSHLRFKDQMLEDQFLDYYRSLEGLSFSKIESKKKYFRDDLNCLEEKLREALNAFQFTEDEINHIASAMRNSNRRSAGEVIEYIVGKFIGDIEFNIKNDVELFKDFLSRMKKLRDDLSHGNSYTLEDKDHIRIMKLRELVRTLLLLELGIKNPFFKVKEEIVEVSTWEDGFEQLGNGLTLNLNQIIEDFKNRERPCDLTFDEESKKIENGQQESNIFENES